jgi:hypothetical protein
MQQPDGQRRKEMLLEGKNAVIYGAGGYEASMTRAK